MVLVLSALQMALQQRRPVHGLIHHTDQGVIYDPHLIEVAYEVQKYVFDAAVSRQLMSAQVLLNRARYGIASAELRGWRFAW